MNAGELNSEVPASVDCRRGARHPRLRLRARRGIGRLLLTALMAAPSVSLVLADQLVSATHNLEMILFNALLVSTPGPIAEEVYRAIAGAESTIRVLQRALFVALFVATGLGAVGIFRVWRTPRKRAEEAHRGESLSGGEPVVS
ncbi:hypothetical protein Q3O97_05855 [Ralstonia pseudosolanacearum]|uniref:hypothetical protein n=1 Tax=Ralstonia pseudosolanacearum TaxID=1310165 RepID=UPI002701AF3F|nr:hypothetical protein [Ralstonia pseudosolanacearum]MDO3615363.1 hypothetical protein [Ralstonia pseudosolanacearum]